MEKVKLFFLKLAQGLKEVLKKIKSKFIEKNSNLTKKNELNLKNIAMLFFGAVSIFIILGLFMPTEDNRVFRQVAVEKYQRPVLNVESDNGSKIERSTADKVWGNANSDRNYSNSQATASQINYNTAMVMGSSKGNAKFEIHAGTRFRIQIIDKFIASNDGTPVVARLLDDVTSESGSTIPLGSLLYGEAVFQKASSRAGIHFKKVSYPNGVLYDIQAKALGSDGMAGLDGNVKSDSIKNAVGQTVTGFVSSMASASMEKDLSGNSKGGTTNGLYNAVAETARDQAQKYGESLKESREWIEIETGIICEAVLMQPYKVIDLSQDGVL